MKVIGERNILGDVPKEINIDGRPYILNNQDGNIVLFDATCPHMGGVVKVKGNEDLICPQHQWEFDSESGKCTTNSGEDALELYDVKVENDKLLADIPESSDGVNFTVSDTDINPEITLVSHSSLLIEYDGFSIVTDPWVRYPGVLDSLIPYPPSTIKPEELAERVDAIWITHEHQDHLHIPTLNHFENDIPVYVPGFNINRLSERVAEAGLTNVHGLQTKVPYTISENIQAVCFESTSTWYDSIFVLNCGGFKILNQNDAGINWEVKKHISDIDFISSLYSAGTSSYPLKWHHLDEDKKINIMRQRNNSHLQSCQQLVEMFSPTYFLPFAKDMELFHPTHNDIKDVIEKNDPGDVINQLKNYGTNVLDLLPGESIEIEDNRINRRSDIDYWLDSNNKERFLNNVYDKYNPLRDQKFHIEHNEIEAYFYEFEGSKLVEKVGDHAFSLHLEGRDKTLYSIVHFKDGQISYYPKTEPTTFDDISSDYHVRMECPGRVVEFIIRNDRSWDHVSGGAMIADFWRDPDEYNLNFWRLLHAPWEARENKYLTAQEYSFETELEGVPMADYADHCVEILSEYGLYCAGCPTAKGEDILEAARIHGLGTDQAEELVESVEKEIINQI